MKKEKTTEEFVTEEGKKIKVMYPKDLELRWTMFRNGRIVNGVHPFTFKEMLFAIANSDSNDEVEIVVDGDW